MSALKAKGHPPSASLFPCEISVDFPDFREGVQGFLASLLYSGAVLIDRVSWLWICSPFWFVGGVQVSEQIPC